MHASTRSHEGSMHHLFPCMRDFSSQSERSGHEGRVASAVVLGVIFLCVGLVPILGCAAETGPVDSDATAGRMEWIVDGTLEESEPAVVLVYNRRGGMCTGSLIAPRVVLTAKHCVQSSGAEGPDPAEFFIVGVGNELRSLSEQYNVAEVRTTPGVYYSDSSRGLRGAIFGIDIALLTLRQGISAFPPKEIRRESAAEMVGRDAIAIGFGQTAAGRSGTKYRADTVVLAVSGGIVYTSPVTCQGDSGGPIIDAETGEVFAVTSFGRGGCGSGIEAGANVVDEFLDMIDDAVGASGACLNDGEERCDSFDNDCDDLVDETCSPLGTACASGDECLGNDCRDTPAGRICTASCDPLRPRLTCGARLFCKRVDGGCEGVCVPEMEGSPMLRADAACADDAECASRYCTDPGDGRRRCLEPCRSDEGLCLSGEVCAAPAGSCGGCVPAEIVSSDRRLGEPCTSEMDCASRLCSIDPGFRRGECALACTSETEADHCPSGFHCRDFMCVRGEREGTGSNCITNEDCPVAHVCARRGPIGWCAPFCDTEACPDGFDCVETPGGSICAPQKLLLGEACAEASACYSGVCEAGVCTRECGVDSPCPTGLVCDRQSDGVTTYCVARTDPPVEESGCRATGRSGGSWWAALCIVVAVAMVSRRTRRRKS
jgi:V8-like Glu-specific endopeptidase